MSGRPFLLWHKKKPACEVLPPVVDFSKKKSPPVGPGRRAARGGGCPRVTNKAHPVSKRDRAGQRPAPGPRPFVKLTSSALRGRGSLAGAETGASTGLRDRLGSAVPFSDR